MYPGTYDQLSDMHLFRVDGILPDEMRPMTDEGIEVREESGVQTVEE
jgi:hypothetical protein